MKDRRGWIGAAMKAYWLSGPLWSVTFGRPLWPPLIAVGVVPLRRKRLLIGTVAPRPWLPNRRIVPDFTHHNPVARHMHLHCRDPAHHGQPGPLLRSSHRPSVRTCLSDLAQACAARRVLGWPVSSEAGANGVGPNSVAAL